eukprot:9492769-Pyramimonas_sp.AAC.1
MAQGPHQEQCDHGISSNGKCLAGSGLPGTFFHGRVQCRVWSSDRGQCCEARALSASKQLEARGQETDLAAGGVFPGS